MTHTKPVLKYCVGNMQIFIGGAASGTYRTIHCWATFFFFFFKRNKNLVYLRKCYQVRAMKSTRMRALVFINVSVSEGVVSRLGSNTAYSLNLPVKYPEETVKLCYGSRAAFPKSFWLRNTF
jgi:hypothetical protein